MNEGPYKDPDLRSLLADRDAEIGRLREEIGRASRPSRLARAASALSRWRPWPFIRFLISGVSILAAVLGICVLCVYCSSRTDVRVQTDAVGGERKTHVWCNAHPFVSVEDPRVRCREDFARACKNGYEVSHDRTVNRHVWMEADCKADP